DILDMNITQVSTLLKNKAISPLEVTKKVLKEIESTNKRTNAFITICWESAMEDAKRAEREMMQGEYRGALHGIPLSVKDNISVQNVRYTSGSSVYQDRISKQDATVVKQLRSEGAII